MADVAVLWMASVACFIVAFIGKAVTIGSVQIPGIAEKKVARIGMAIVGTLALVLGPMPLSLISIALLVMLRL